MRKQKHNTYQECNRLHLDIQKETSSLLESLDMQTMATKKITDNQQDWVLKQLLKVKESGSS